MSLVAGPPVAAHPAELQPGQHSTVQYSTVQYSAVQYSTVQYLASWPSTEARLVLRLLCWEARPLCSEDCATLRFPRTPVTASSPLLVLLLLLAYIRAFVV